MLPFRILFHVEPIFPVLRGAKAVNLGWHVALVNAPFASVADHPELQEVIDAVL